MAISRTLPVLLVAAALVLGGCGDDDGGDGGGGDSSDRAATIAALVESGDFEGDGENLYRRSCASCHGGSGQGGIGPQLVGVADRYEPQAHVAIVLTGRGAMTGFGASLDDDEIAAIVSYERNELGQD